DRRPEKGGGYRTTALFRRAVMRPPPRQGSGFVTEEQKAKKRGEKGEKQSTRGLSGACG
ncbi:hypothetical protein KI387_021901, partial [Taxus chinensis]